MENKMLELLKTRRSVRAYKPDQVTPQALDAVLEAGTYAPTGMGMQSPVIVAVQNPKYRQAVMELNQLARGMEGDPYYGAPTILLVLADPDRGTCVEDGSCVLCTMMDAAHALGLASCWIHGEREMFELPQGKALLKEWGPAGKPPGGGLPGPGLRRRPRAPAQRAQGGLHPQSLSKSEKRPGEAPAFSCPLCFFPGAAIIEPTITHTGPPGPGPWGKVCAMKRKMLCALLAGLLLCGGLLGGCAGGYRGGELPYLCGGGAGRKTTAAPPNWCWAPQRRTPSAPPCWEEIAEKYTADFPNTQVEVRSYGSKEALQAALASGEADIGEMEEADVPQAVEEGLLLDLYDWVDTWEERYSLSPGGLAGHPHHGGKTTPTSSPMTSTSWSPTTGPTGSRSTTPPAESAITPREWCRNWNQIARTVERLGEKGKVAFGGKERLGQLFDAALWGDLSLGRLGAQGAAYFAAGDEHLTIFTWEMLPEAVENFKEHYQCYTLPQSLEWTEEQAVEAFLNGEAAILFAGSGVGEELAASLPEGSWGTIGPVQGGHRGLHHLRPVRGLGRLRPQ